MSRSPLEHPLWIAALAVLIVNDHFLKGAGILPGWLTGKLSDFAGLIVAPVLAAAIVRARSTGARAAALAVVSAVFAAIKLSPAAARALEAALALAHIHWRIWSDASDLAALVVLPIAWRLTAALPVRPRAPHASLRLKERLLLITGAVACLATSPEAPPYFTVPLSLENRTDEPQQIALYRADVSAYCDAIKGGDLSALASAAWAVDGCLEVDTGKSAPLGSIISVSPKHDGGVDAGGEPACQAVVVRAVGLTDTILSWPAIVAESQDLQSGNVYLEAAGSQLFIAGTDYVAAAPATFALPPSLCVGLP